MKDKIKKRFTAVLAVILFSGILVGASSAQATPAVQSSVAVASADLLRASVLTNGVPIASSAQVGPAAAPRDSLSSSQKRCAEVQLRLAGLGYYKGRVDAKCGPLSQRAIKQWRQSQHIQRTGTLTKSEYNRLRKQTFTGYSVVVYLSKQEIIFFRDGDGRGFYTDHVSTGKVGSETEVVNAKVLYQSFGWRQSLHTWRYYPSFFMDSYPSGLYDTALQGCEVVPSYPSTWGDVCLRILCPGQGAPAGHTSFHRRVVPRNLQRRRFFLA